MSYRPDIQGLRAIAVLAVMAFHFNPVWLPGGFIGVDVFLVISGFLITSILLKKKSQPDLTLGSILKIFFTSRFKRIAPAYFAMLVLVTLVAAVLFIPQDFDTFKDGLEKAVWFNSNYYFADFGNYFAPANHEQPLLHTWSLAVEIQFYLLAPVLVLVLPSKALKWVLAGLLIAFTLLAEYRLRVLGIEHATYYSLFARLPEFFAGCLAALCLGIINGKSKTGRGQPALGIALILLAAIAQPTLGHFPGIPALLPTLGTVLVLTSSATGKVSRILSSRTLVWIGALSYSLYIWHWPVLAFLRYYTGSEMLDFPSSLLFILLTLSLSAISYYWVEHPLRKTGRKPGSRSLWGYAVLLVAIIGTSQAMDNVNAAFTPEQTPIEYRRYADLEKICHGQIVGDCLRGDLNSDREVLVLGDSHAAMLNHFFDYLGKELEFKARIITASSCVTIPGFDYQRISEWAHSACMSQIEEASEYLEDAKTIILAGMWSYQTRSDAFNNALSTFFQGRENKNIYLISQVPKFTRNVARVQRFSALGIPFSMRRDSDYKQGNARVAEMAAQYTNVEYLEFDSLEMFNRPFLQHEKFIYRDASHLNELGAKTYAQAAKSRFSELIAVISNIK